MADSRQTGVRCVVVTPEATVLDTQARFVAVPLYDGERGVGRGHAPFIGRLGAGEVRIVVFSAVLAILVWIKHHGNIRRLLRGEEPKIGKRKAEAPG